jgi:dTDP-glucose pyrophosphorylase
VSKSLTDPIITPKDTSLVILAGGLGSRFGGNKQLALLPGLNKTILELSIQDAFEAGIKHIVLVINQAIKYDVEQYILPRLDPELIVDLAIQSIDDVPDNYKKKALKRKKPWGTGHALLAAKPYVKSHFIVITADDYYGKSAFNTLLLDWRKDQTWRLLGYPLKSTLTEQGGVNRGICQLQGNKLKSITEVLNIDTTFKGQTLTGEAIYLSGNEYTSMTIWTLDYGIFSQLERSFISFLDKNDSAIIGELFLPDQIQYLIDHNDQVVNLFAAKDCWLGVTYNNDLSKVAKQLLK